MKQLKSINNQDILDQLKKYPNQGILFEIIESGVTGTILELSQDVLIVRENCNNSVSSQISKGLIMDENANVNLIPELEISNDDVVCSHGAASGKPDENVLFYLTSRGISRKEAEKVYIQGFLGEFVDKIDNAQMKAKAKQFISQNS